MNWNITFIKPTCDISDIRETKRVNRVRAQFDITARCGCSTRCWIVMSPLEYVFQNNKSASGRKVNVKLFKCIHMEIPCPGAIDGKEFGAPRGPRMQSHFIWLCFFQLRDVFKCETQKSEEDVGKVSKWKQEVITELWMEEWLENDYYSIQREQTALWWSEWV